MRAAVAWTEEADVVVVIGVRPEPAPRSRRGTRVQAIVVDRFEGGGASALSGGVVYAGGGTSHQRQAGFEGPSRQAMFDHLRLELRGRGRRRNPVALLPRQRRQPGLAGAARRARSTPPCRHKTSYPPDGCYLYSLGNEVVPAYRGEHAPAPRGHRTFSGARPAPRCMPHCRPPRWLRARRRSHNPACAAWCASAARDGCWASRSGNCHPVTRRPDAMPR